MLHMWYEQMTTATAGWRTRPPESHGFTVHAEQDEIHVGTDIHHSHAPCGDR
ncbi:hypothetical protein ACH4SP_36965 [Streptomyces sp. NPDC021093]|uniref:hypothetical protein n=1 Tax=Streptomyces sp. NPDC021093 TaxID=3365112 RepID=UPI00379EECAA